MRSLLNVVLICSGVWALDARFSKRVVSVRGGAFDFHAHETGQMFGIADPEKAVVDAEKAVAAAIFRRVKALFRRNDDLRELDDALADVVALEEQTATTANAE
mmetsp:Transcript_4350/g.14430  ORF Transcript_4350/g.14430 Transcript_4350/m.14430 type:complete len:103 (+) Transcript_4350:94-402(+)